MRKSLVLVAVAAATVGLAAPSFAKLPKAAPLVVSDPAGDANVASAQDANAPVPSMRAGADIVSVRLGRTERAGAVKAFTVSMTLAAAPESSTQYRVVMAAPGCSTWNVEYQFPPDGTDVVITKGGLVRENCTGASVFTDVPAEVKGNTILWTIPVKGMPGGVKLGTELDVKYGQTNLETAVIGPAFDKAPINKKFVVGQ